MMGKREREEKCRSLNHRTIDFFTAFSNLYLQVGESVQPSCMT